MFPDDKTHISSASGLTEVLKRIKRCMADGTLRQVRPAEAPWALENLHQVPDEGPWPDYLEAHFEDCRGQRYLLSVETYHGGGGTWERST